MDMNELQDKSTAELTELLAATRAQLHAHRLDVRAGRLNQMHTISNSKKTIARILTMLAQRSATAAAT